jgi:hypothetical protein
MELLARMFAPNMPEESVRIIEVKTKKELYDFIKFPFSLYPRDSFYSPQLIRDQLIHFSHANPFFKHSEIKFFLAFKGTKAVGRISTIINYRHLDFHKDDAGFFGFFESINDEAVSFKLLGAASDMLKKRNLKIIRGPMNFSTNEDCGFLIDGYDIPPMIMTPYNPPYYNDLMESYGMRKAKDLYAFIYNNKDELPEKVNRISAIAEKSGITTRALDKKNFIFDMLAFREIYNSAWENNWGFIPLSEDELFYSAKKLKQVMVPEFTILAFDGEEPIGFLGAIPDYNFVLRHMRGRLNPLTIAKAFYYSKKIDSLRLLLLGVKKEFRNKGVDALMFKEGDKNRKNTKFQQYKKIEFSWILEDNIPVIRLAEIFDAKPYKRYRIYEKLL